MSDAIETQAEVLANEGLSAAAKWGEAFVAAKAGPFGPLLAAAIAAGFAELQKEIHPLADKAVSAAKDFFERLEIFFVTGGVVGTQDKLHALSPAELRVAFDVCHDPSADPATAPRPHGWEVRDLHRPDVIARVDALCQFYGLIPPDKG